MMMKKGFLIVFLSLVCLSGSVSSQADQYHSGGKRDPFVPLIGAGRSSVKYGLSEVYSIDDVNLQGIVVGAGGKKAVIVNGEVVNEGDKKGVFSVENISDNSVKVKLGDETFEIKLYER